jgi:hypothetical protein
MRTMLILFLMVMSLAAAAPAQTTQPLFVIERTKNANKLYYQAVIGADGALDPEQPVKAHWIMWAKDPSGRTTEGMNLIERTKVYGFNIKPDGAGRFRMTLKPFKDRLIRVYLKDAVARAEMLIDGRPSYFDKMYIFSPGDSKPDSIKLFGTDVESGEPSYEKVVPKKD